MKASKHETLKAQWQELIKEQSESGLSIREEALIKARTLNDIRIYIACGKTELT